MSKFKVGDRVLVKDNFDFGENAPLGCGLFCILPHPIEAIDNDRAFLTTIWDFPTNRPTMAYVPLEALILCSEQTEHTEQTEPTDPKAAFLEEFRELLMRHNASIEITEDFPDCSYIKFNIGNESVSYEDIGLTEVGGEKREIITADNIMSYDKEGV